MEHSRILFTLLVFILLGGISSCKKTGDNSQVTPPVVLPAITILDVSQPRSALNTSMQFYLNTNKAVSNTLSIDYSLVDGTATSVKDFISTSGTITIPANKTQAIIEVQILGDPTNLRQPNLQFTIQLSNPKNCTLITNSAKGIIQTEDGTFLTTDNKGFSSPLTYPGYTLVWSDEFTAGNLDPAIWNQEVGNGTGGWGNHELEYYTNSLKNSFLSNGNLIIEARQESILGYNYSSARLTTQNKKSFKFGRIDIRAKLPVAKGMWPALWMLGTNITSVGWPTCGEIDIMELVGSAPSNVKATMHWKDGTGNHTSKGADYTLSSGNFSQEFHVFSMVWEKDSIKCYVDDHLTTTVTSTDAGADNYPFNADQFFIFNVATGGDWPGPPDGSTPFPQRMFVDYVRVFQ